MRGINVGDDQQRFRAVFAVTQAVGGAQRACRVAGLREQFDRFPHDAFELDDTRKPDVRPDIFGIPVVGGNLAEGIQRGRPRACRVPRDELGAPDGEQRRDAVLPVHRAEFRFPRLTKTVGDEGVGWRWIHGARRRDGCLRPRVAGKHRRQHRRERQDARAQTGFHARARRARGSIRRSRTDGNGSRTRHDSQSSTLIVTYFT